MAKEPLAVQYLDASDRDADSFAALHADSWRRHYRGAYFDSYLDGDIVTNRQEVWRSRLDQPRCRHHGVVRIRCTVRDEMCRGGSK